MRGRQGFGDEAVAKQTPDQRRGCRACFHGVNRPCDGTVGEGRGLVGKIFRFVRTADSQCRTPQLLARGQRLQNGSRHFFIAYEDRLQIAPENCLNRRNELIFHFNKRSQRARDGRFEEVRLIQTTQDRLSARRQARARLIKLAQDLKLGGAA